jgi:acyl-coenzyme A thioesterase PaaI-like protein
MAVARGTGSPFLRDLRVLVQRGAESHAVALPSHPNLVDASGALRASVLLTIADLAAAGLVNQRLFPQVALTVDCAFYRIGLAPVQQAVARSTIQWQGRSGALVGVTLQDGLDPEAPAIGTATLMFSSFKRDGPVPDRGPEPSEEWVEFGLPDSGFRRPVFEQIGIHTLPKQPHTAALELTPYVCTSAGKILQGGVTAMLAEAAAEEAAGHALAAPVAVDDLSLRYLAPGKLGPVHARGEVLALRGDQALVRVQIADTGAAATIATAICSARTFPEQAA